MSFASRARDLPGRIATGAYVLHAGLDKWSAEEDRATAIHAMAVGGFPIFGDMEPARFVRLLAASEIAVGAALLMPTVSNTVAGLALTGFSGGLLTMYWRTPTMRKPGSAWPTPAGTAASKDVWMLAIGLGLIMSPRTKRPHKRRK